MSSEYVALKVAPIPIFSSSTYFTPAEKRETYAELLENGWKKIDVPAQGACLFQSFSVQSTGTVNIGDHLKIRRQIIDHIVSGPTTLWCANLIS